MLGKNEKELLAYDEYDSEGSGKWFTDNPIMANEYYGFIFPFIVPIQMDLEF